MSIKDKWTYAILGLGTILLFGMLVYFLFIRETNKPIEYVITINDSHAPCPDSTRYLSKVDVDSLISVIEKHEYAVGQKYQYIVDRKKADEDAFTYASFIVAIILGLFGFFGYKSIDSIRERALKDASETIEIAKKRAEEITKKYLEQNLQGMVKINSEDLFNDKAYTTFESKIINNVTNPIEDEIEDNSQKIKDLKEEIEDLRLKISVSDNEPVESSNNNELAPQEINTSMSDSDEVQTNPTNLFE